MKCPECVAANLRSRVTPGYSYTTAMAGVSYYDEDGIWHSHDPNHHTTSYSCSNGHQWTESRIYSCHACERAEEVHNAAL